jgi:RHS repeat-associated protein
MASAASASPTTFFEPGSFVPVAQAVEQRSIQLLAEPVYEGAYDIDRDPVWQHRPKPVTFSAFAWYQCDHLGTPMELTDEQGDIAWSGIYKAWGLAKEQRSETAKHTDIRNPLRFQGQYFDVETGLHYNRYRYYDPQVGRFIGKDPIGFSGGLNTFLYATTSTGWTDPLGLCSKKLNNALGGQTNDNMQAHHIIPEQVWADNESFLNRIGLAGKRDAKENGVLMPDSPEKAKSMRRKFYHCGSHAMYSRKIE